MEITINRDSISPSDEMQDHTKVYELDGKATYKDLFRVLKKTDISQRQQEKMACGC